MAREPPDHDPIRIDGDADLLAPDTPADDDGVREGSGTRNDPFVIRNWRISSDENDGIHILDTTLHLVIEDLDIVQKTPREKSVGVHLENARNVTIRNVTISGVHDYGVFSRRAPDLVIRDINVSIVPDEDIFEFGIYVTQGAAEVESSLITLESGPGTGRAQDGTGVALKCQRASVIVQNVRLRGFPGFFSSTVPPEGNHCTTVIFEDNKISPPRKARGLGFFDTSDRVTIRDNTGPVVYHVTVRDRMPRAVIEGNDMQGLDLESVEGASLSFNDEVQITQNRFNGRCRGSSTCQTFGLRIQESVSTPVAVSGNRFTGYASGRILSIASAPFNATGNAFFDNFHGQDSGTVALIRAGSSQAEVAKDAGHPYQAFRGNDFLRHPNDQAGRAIEYRGSAGPLPATGNYWGPDPPIVCQGPRPEGCDEPTPRWSIQGDVKIDPWSTTPNVLSESFVQDYFANYDTGNLVPTLHPAAVLTTLLIAALATEATRRN